MFVKKGDKVRVIAGKDKGTEAVVLTALPKVNKVIVEGVNIVKKHQRPTNELPQGGIIEKEAAIHVSNVQKCLINHEGKEKYNGKSFKRKIS